LSQIIQDIPFNTEDDGGITFDTNVTFNGGIVFGQAVTEVITTDKDDYNIPGISAAVLFRADFKSKKEITGIVPPDITKSTLVVVLNVGTKNGKLSNNDSASQPENRFLFKGSITLEPHESAALIYDTVSQRWRAFSVYT
jgi:hypothetical protein